MARAQNFRDLIDHARRKGRADYLRPRSPAWAARVCGISVPYLYFLMDGIRTASEWKVVLIARGLGLTPIVVQRALNRSRKEAA